MSYSPPVDQLMPYLRAIPEERSGLARALVFDCMVELEDGFRQQRELALRTISEAREEEFRALPWDSRATKDRVMTTIGACCVGQGARLATLAGELEAFLPPEKARDLARHVGMIAYNDYCARMGDDSARYVMSPSLGAARAFAYEGRVAEDNGPTPPAHLR